MNRVTEANKLSKLFRNIFFVFIINFFVMVSLGANLLATIVDYILSGFSYSIKEKLFGVSGSWLGNFLDYFFKGAILAAPFQFLLFAIFFVVWLILAFLRKNLTFLLTKKEIWALVISQWLFLILIILMEVTRFIVNLGKNENYFKGDYDGLLLGLSGIITSFIFWYLITSLLKKEK